MIYSGPGKSYKYVAADVNPWELTLLIKYEANEQVEILFDC